MHKYNIAVIGCGVIGLTSALAIQKKLNFHVQITIFSEFKSPNTTGDLAAGLWSPYLIQDTPEELVEEWSKATYNYILNLWKLGKAKELGISLQLITILSSQDNFTLPKWSHITLSCSKLTSNQLENYSKRIDEKLTGGFSFIGFIWEASKFLPYFENEFIKNGGKIVIKKIIKFDELSNFDLIVNCSGINSKYLVPDFDIKPIRGQIMRVKAPWQFHTLLLNCAKCNYIIPNENYVILGGTHQNDDYNLIVNDSDKKDIMKGCQALIPSLNYIKIVRDSVGLRPGRNQVRLELEIRNVYGKNLNIVHNYGHGGSGITLCIGCAQHCAQIVKRFFFPSQL